MPYQHQWTIIFIFPFVTIVSVHHHHLLRIHLSRHCNNNENVTILWSVKILPANYKHSLFYFVFGLSRFHAYWLKALSRFHEYEQKSCRTCGLDTSWWLLGDLMSHFLAFLDNSWPIGNDQEIRDKFWSIGLKQMSFFASPIVILGHME